MLRSVSSLRALGSLLNTRVAAASNALSITVDFPTTPADSLSATENVRTQASDVLTEVSDVLSEGADRKTDVSDFATERSDFGKFLTFRNKNHFFIIFSVSIFSNSR